MQKTDIQNVKDIEMFVNNFYEKVRDDELLAPVFNAKIKNWESHLIIMYKFWGSILLAEESYRGQPFFKHVNLPIEAEHFERWLQLFYETISEHFEGSTADLAIVRAEAIAHIFYSRIVHIRSGKKSLL